MLKKYLQQIVILIITLVFFHSCAKEMAPTGGPKDTTPPLVIREIPPNNSVNFDEKRIKIYFDEFVQLKNIQEELLISPPFAEKPKMVLKGKKLVITFQDTLPTNKTVNFSFYNAIVDINEGNPLYDYQYVFSTGNTIDTSFIDGRLLYAETGKAVEKTHIHLYENFEDSVVSKKLPSYMARTNKDGIFVIKSLGTGPYKLFALDDKNRNDLYDQPTEPIAFVFDSIKPEVEWTTIYDTLQIIDSINVALNDTVFYDSIIENRVQVSKLKPFQMRMFVKDYKKHYIRTKKRLRMGLFSFGFNRPLDTIGFSAELLKPQTDKNTWFEEERVSSDSLLYWVSDSALYKSDSIQLKISYPFNDSLNNIITKTDTIFLAYDLDKLTKEDTTISIKNNLRSNKLDIDTTLQITFSEPVKEVNEDLIYFKIKTDTAFANYPFQWNLVTNKQATVSFNPDLLADYRLILDSLSVTGMYGNVLDSSVTTFSFFEKGDYGNFILLVDTLQPNAIYELIQKKKVVRRIKYATQKSIDFNQLIPGKYNLRVLIDNNNNGVWDTGNYYEKLQPELIIAFPTEIVIKENWDTEQNWDISDEYKLFD
jgi:hypothetical protein